MGYDMWKTVFHLLVASSIGCKIAKELVVTLATTDVSTFDVLRVAIGLQGLS